MTEILDIIQHLGHKHPQLSDVGPASIFRWQGEIELHSLLLSSVERASNNLFLFQYISFGISCFRNLTATKKLKVIPVQALRAPGG
jgi:hypothetical protein